MDYLISFGGLEGSLRWITSLVMTREFQTDLFKITFLKDAENSVKSCFAGIEFSTSDCIVGLRSLFYQPIYTLGVKVKLCKTRRSEDYCYCKKSFRGKLWISRCLFCVHVSITPVGMYNTNKDASSRPHVSVTTESLPSSSFPFLD